MLQEEGDKPKWLPFCRIRGSTHLLPSDLLEVALLPLDPKIPAWKELCRQWPRSRLIAYEAYQILLTNHKSNLKPFFGPSTYWFLAEATFELAFFNPCLCWPSGNRATPYFTLDLQCCCPYSDHVTCTARIWSLASVTSNWNTLL